MPGENFSRRVARAASVGGGRSYRRQTPLGWYGLLLAICVIGVGLVAYSRYEISHPVTTATKAKASQPPNKNNMWEVALAVDVCGKVSYLPATTTSDQPFFTNGKGVVTIEPGLSSDPAAVSGKHAVLNAFLVPAGVSLTDTTLALIPPSSAASTTTSTSSTTTSTSAATTSTAASSKKSSASSTTTTTLPSKYYENGQSCEGKKGVVETEVWSSPSAKHGKIVTKNAPQLRFKNGQLFTIAFLPKGAPIPRPASASAISTFLISNPTGLATSSSSSSTATSTTSPATSTSTSSSTSPSTTSGGANDKGSKKKSG